MTEKFQKQLAETMGEVVFARPECSAPRFRVLSSLREHAEKGQGPIIDVPVWDPAEERDRLEPVFV